MQFWILGDNDYGMGNFRNILKNSNRRVIYYPNIEEYYTKEELQEVYQPYIEEDFYASLEEGVPFGLEFSLEKQSIGASDFRFNLIFTKKWNQTFLNYPIEEVWDLNEIDSKLYEYVYEKFFNEGIKHQIGGYGWFTQEDPRGFEDYIEYTPLLLQIDSDWNKEYTIMWGDAGVANFFATKQQLEELKFDEVLYTWDCG